MPSRSDCACAIAASRSSSSDAEGPFAALFRPIICFGARKRTSSLWVFRGAGGNSNSATAKKQSTGDTTPVSATAEDSARTGRTSRHAKTVEAVASARTGGRSARAEECDGVIRRSGHSAVASARTIGGRMSANSVVAVASACTVYTQEAEEWLETVRWQ